MNIKGHNFVHFEAGYFECSICKIKYLKNHKYDDKMAISLLSLIYVIYEEDLLTCNEYIVKDIIE